MARTTDYIPNSTRFLKMYADLAKGQICKPRGQAILELEDYVLELDAGDSCITSFRDRKMSIGYAASEFLWYLKGDPYDTSIEKHASMWPKIKQPEGFYFSNYGQYMFGRGAGVRWAIEELMRDKDSRRAAFPFLKLIHCFADNRDMVCTYSMGFRIRENRLNMSVNMRSNDAIYGTTNDVFCFWMVYKLVYAALHQTYRDLLPGRYVHKVDSLHVYEKHWEMLNRLNHTGEQGYFTIYIPDPSAPEAWTLINGDEPISEEFGAFTQWLIRNSQNS